jgi:tripartite-type tricarboxylate transporter receptor subunit TctC
MLPDIPTPAEAGSTSLEVDGLIGVFGPKTLSQESRNRIGADIVAAASADPTFAQRLATTGQIFLPAGALEFQASVREQMEKVAQVAKLIGMSPR